MFSAKYGGDFFEVSYRNFTADNLSLSTLAEVERADGKVRPGKAPDEQKCRRLWHFWWDVLILTIKSKHSLDVSFREPLQFGQLIVNVPCQRRG